MIELEKLKGNQVAYYEFSAHFRNVFIANENGKEIVKSPQYLEHYPYHLYGGAYHLFYTIVTFVLWAVLCVALLIVAVCVVLFVIHYLYDDDDDDDRDYDDSPIEPDPNGSSMSRIVKKVKRNLELMQN